MVNVITDINCIHIDKTLIPKNTVNIILIKNGIRIQDVDLGSYIDIKTANVLLDGVPPSTNMELLDFFKNISFGTSDNPPEQNPLFNELNQLMNDGILINFKTYNLSI